MSLIGTAVVAIWNDIKPEARENFIEWHNREHIPERVGIEGFLRGRRYVALSGTPEYFTLYEARDGDVLTGQAYLERLNNPTDWTRGSTSAFRNTTRGVCTVAHSAGPGDGGVMATLRFDAGDDAREALEGELTRRLALTLRHAGICGAHLCIADREASGVETAEGKGRAVGVPNWIVLVEGSGETAVADAVTGLLDRGSGLEGSTGPVERGLYRLEFCLARHPSRPMTGAMAPGIPDLKGTRF